MKHLGDITKINGATAPVVDVIIGGSPCQDLSMAGKRAGLAGERSGLYMEQLRIIKEMRKEDERNGRTGVDVRPRYMVWENVPGAFSCNHGEDFAAVLTEAVRVIEPKAPDVPVPKNGWPHAGCLLGGNWSIAWRVLDAQFWGVPQRRRRIALVADFGGESAPEILFVRESVSGHSEPGKPQREEAAGDAGAGAACAGFPLGFRPENVRLYRETSATLCNGTRPGFTAGCVTGCFDWRQGAKAGSIAYSEEVSPTLKCDGAGRSAVMIEMTSTKNTIVEDGICPTLTARMGTGGNQVNAVCECKSVYHAEAQVSGIDFYNQQETGSVSKPMTSSATDSDHVPCVRNQMVVRRLTPLECERLQGVPDGWTDIGEWVDSNGKKHKEADSPRYKALGNSIALPPWKWVLKRICACYERDATMASLFDGIGGFPLIWEQLNGKGSCLWASEIEEFPIAVTKLRFGDD